MIARSNDVNGTPFLQDIPVIGHLFKNDSKKRDTRELIFLISPHVVRNASLIRPKSIPQVGEGPLALGTSPLGQAGQ